MTKYSRMMRITLEIGLGKSVLPSVGHYIIYYFFYDGVF